MTGNFQKSIKNVAISIGSSIFSIVLSFFSRSFFIHFLSVEYLGISGLFANILTILSFSEMGIGNVMVYSLYDPLKRSDHQKIKALLRVYQKAFWVVAGFILVAGSILNPFIMSLIRSAPDVPENIHLLFALYLCNTVMSYLYTYKKTMLLADQKNYIASIVTSTMNAVMILCQCILLYLTRSFVLYLLCQIVCTFLINIILTKIVNKQYPYLLDTNEEKLEPAQIRKLFSNIKALAISKVSGVVSSGTDNIIISKMFGIVPVGLVANYTLLINSVNSIFYTALTSVSGSIGSFNVDSTPSAKQTVFDQLFMVVFCLYSFICTCLLVLTQPFITLWLGEAYVMPSWVLIHLVIGIYVGSMNYPVYSFRTTAGLFQEVQYVYVACAITNVVLSILLGEIFNVAGVFMATWVSKLMLTEVADSYFTYKRVLQKNPWLYWCKYASFAMFAAVNALICWFVVTLVPTPGWFGFILKCVTCGLLNISINLCVLRKTCVFQTLRKRFDVLYHRRFCQ